MKKKILAALMVAVLAFSMLGATAFAQKDVNLGQQDGQQPQMPGEMQQPGQQPGGNMPGQNFGGQMFG